MAVRSCSLCQRIVFINLLWIINMPIKRLQETACVCVCNRRRRRRWSAYRSASHFSWTSWPPPTLRLIGWNGWHSALVRTLTNNVGDIRHIRTLANHCCRSSLLTHASSQRMSSLLTIIVLHLFWGYVVISLISSVLQLILVSDCCQLSQSPLCMLASTAPWQLCYALSARRYYTAGPQLSDTLGLCTVTFSHANFSCVHMLSSSVSDDVVRLLLQIKCVVQVCHACSLDVTWVV